MPVKGPVCPGCGSASRLASNSEIYGPKVKYDANVWMCSNYPDCDYYVGVVPGTADPTGTMAGPRLRTLRSQLYAYLKPLCTDHKTKIKVYREIAGKMGWQGRLNISALDEVNCLKALKIANPNFVDPDEATANREIPRSWQDID